MQNQTANFLYHGPCPTCGSSDALSHYDDGHTHCFSCNTTTQPKRQQHAEGSERMTTAKPLLPSGDIRPLTKRKLSEETLKKFHYTIGTHRGKPVQIAPYYDKKGNLVAQHLRYPDKEFAWVGNTKNLQLWGQQLWRDGGKMLVITEGEIDALSVSQAQGNKYPVVSIPSGAQGAKKAILNNLAWVESYERVILAFDMDEAGRAAAQECALLLTPGKARIATLPLKDASDMLQEGLVKEIISSIWDAKVYRPDGLVSGKDLLAELLTEPKEGYKTPYHHLNDKLKGIRKGELYLFSAGSGMGKSTLVNEIGYHFLMQHGLSLGVIALEENKKRTAERYAGMYLNKPIHVDREGVTKEDLERAFEAVLNTDNFWLYDHFGSTNLDNLLGQIRYMVVALGCDFIILDHISIVVSGLDDTDGDERRLIDKLMTKLRSLIEETGVGVLATVHLKRPEGGKGFTEGRQVSLSDLRGSGALEQLSDVVIALERNQTDEHNQNMAFIRVLKNRPVGLVGLCDRLEYDQETGRLNAEKHFDDFTTPATTPTQPTKQSKPTKTPKAPKAPKTPKTNVPVTAPSGRTAEEAEEDF